MLSFHYACAYYRIIKIAVQVYSNEPGVDNYTIGM